MRTLPDQKLKQTVHERVRNFVLSNRVKPGAKIDESALALELGVSKTPVREVLFKFSQDGIVKIVLNKGCFKVKLTEKDVLDIMEIRELLEGLAARYAAENATAQDLQEMRVLHEPFAGVDFEANVTLYAEVDEKFHSLLFRLSEQGRLIQMLQNLNCFNSMLRQELFGSPERIKKSVKGHAAIIKALEARDGKRAERTVRRVVRASRKYLMRVLSETRKMADSPRADRKRIAGARK
jgi:DNA-binding GntR family transcriptional regulator